MKVSNRATGVISYAFLTVILMAGAAQSLAGTNTVTTDDIVDKNVTNADLGTNAVTSNKIANGTVGPADLSSAIHKAYFARIAANGSTVSLIAGDATSAARGPAGGEVTVTFPFNVTACATTATVAIGPGSSSQVYGPFSFVIDHRGIVSPTKVTVDMRTASNGPVYENFDLTLICP